MRAVISRLLLAVISVFLFFDNASAKGAKDNAYLVRCPGSCASALAEIKRTGGSVKYQFKNISALSVRLNPIAKDALIKLLGSQSISKDVQVKIPPPKDQHRKLLQPGASRSINQAQLKAIVSARTKDYIFNNAANGALSAHQDGFLGNDVIVAVIDTGTANNAELAPALAGSVIGGESFVEGDTEPSATSTENDEHGTWVASMIAAHSLFVLPENDELVQSISQHAAESLIPMENGVVGIPMIGMAPAAKIYALKTFAADGNGAPQSVILAAMDRAITLKKNFNEGKPSVPVSGTGSEDDPKVFDSLNIQVVNMSLGGATLNPGYDLEDRLSVAMMQQGMVLVTSAGNEGPGAITVGSPATGYGSLSVGAASNASNERILRDLQFGAGTGLEFRPHNDIQLAYFSSRGPNADGRRGPDIVSNGYGTFVQGPQGTLDFISGTSLSSPTIAGAAALLYGAKPKASPRQVMASLLRTADRDTMVGDLSPFDQGMGFLKVNRALKRIIDQDDDDDDDTRIALPGATPEPQQVYPVLRDVVKIHRLDEEYEGAAEVKPGQIKQLFFNLPHNVSKVELRFEKVEPELPPDRQNPIFGDDLLVSLLDAPLSINHVLMEDFIFEPGRYQFDLPQPGIMRLAIVGDWTNVGKVKTKFSLRSKTKSPRELPLQGRIMDQETQVMTMNIPPDTPLLDMELRWRGDWTMNPSFDIDVILISPSGELIFDGASLHSPERVQVPTPEAGEWTVIVDGYELHGMQDRYELGAFDDNGKTIPVTP